MGNILIINGSPRAPISNTKRYSQLLCKYANSGSCDYREITKNNHQQIIADIANYQDLILAFPLYADSLPATLFAFLKTLENSSIASKPRISIMINCGFLEYQQNDLAIEIVKLYCSQNNYPLGSILKIGSGEAILDTPFKFIVKHYAKKFITSIIQGKYACYHCNMPISKKMFLKASTRYWIAYGQKNGIDQTQMDTMKIEDQ